jgi:carbon starvation protein
MTSAPTGQGARAVTVFAAASVPNRELTACALRVLWQLFGIGNQMLAGIALLLCTVVLMKMKRDRYVWVTPVPTAWLLVTTLTAGWQKIFHPTPSIGFLAQARRFSDAVANGTILAPAKTVEEMQRVAFNNYLDATVCAFFVLLVLAMCIYAIVISLKAPHMRANHPGETLKEPGEFLVWALERRHSARGPRCC